MSTLWIGNFEFEDELRGSPSLSVAGKRFCAELAPCLVAAAAPGDYVLCPEPLLSADYPALQETGPCPPRLLTLPELEQERSNITALAPWGWTNTVRTLARQLQVKTTGPAEVSVLQANSRISTFEIASAIGCALPGEQPVGTLAELRRVLQSPLFESGFVLKTEWGQSGRGQFRQQTQSLPVQIRDWSLRQFERNSQLMVEPHLQPEVEYGIQWTLPEHGKPQLLGVTHLLANERGGYYGSLTGVSPENTLHLAEILEVQSAALLELQRWGYWGPVGIDAMIARPLLGASRSLLIRPLQDINARWTMGRLALHWAARCFPDDQQITWCHAIQAPTTEARCTSPLRVGGQPVKYRTWCHQ